ncbi:hypothetical protein CFBP5877_03915 [Agrobacterium tumefaciens]|uniref:Uncharacterized protein n=1 Tax=Agrobacterium tumefaciens TaxID=358 RepID=A0AAE6B8H5_AGRTU|nr:hypothetical protein CFBP5499_04355 [Agrobacterium tumefaciens]QCL78308.1 hypothetical protein CFBP5877_03915 [Agrobacterium tumefaciens]
MIFGPFGLELAFLIGVSSPARRVSFSSISERKIVSNPINDQRQEKAAAMHSTHNNGLFVFATDQKCLNRRHA